MANIKLQKMSLKKLNKLILDNNGASGLDLRCFDFSGMDLHGMNLSGAILGNDDPSGACAILKNTRLTGANLAGANLMRVDLSGSNLYVVNLEFADLRWANLSNSGLRGANLNRANLYRARLHGTDLWQANLLNADLFMASFDSQTYLPKSSLGDALLQENSEEYKQFLNMFIPIVTARNPEIDFAGRFFKASEIYRRVKSVFLANGYYSDASWAYFQERRMRRIASAPWNSKGNYGLKNERGQYINSPLGFSHLKYTKKWLLDLFAEYSCGYGELPLRTLYFSLGIIFFFSLLFFFTGGISFNAGTMGWYDYAIYSIATFVTIGFSNYESTTVLARVLTSIESFAGVCMLALVMFTLGNRINRS